MWAFPSIEKTAVWIPLPFFVTYDLGAANNTSEDVFYNKNKAYIQDSDSDKVQGDELGTNKGVISQTTQKAATTFPSSYASSVKINGKHAHRCGDFFTFLGFNKIWVIMSDIYLRRITFGGASIRQVYLG